MSLIAWIRCVGSWGQTKYVLVWGFSVETELGSIWIRIAEKVHKIRQ